MKLLFSSAGTGNVHSCSLVQISRIEELEPGAESLQENTEELEDTVIGPSEHQSPSLCPQGGGPCSVWEETETYYRTCRQSPISLYNIPGCWVGWMLWLQATPTGHPRIALHLPWSMSPLCSGLHFCPTPSSHKSGNESLEPLPICQLGVPKQITFCDSLCNKISPQTLICKISQPHDPQISRTFTSSVELV